MKPLRDVLAGFVAWIGWKIDGQMCTRWEDMMSVYGVKFKSNSEYAEPEDVDYINAKLELDAFLKARTSGRK